MMKARTLWLNVVLLLALLLPGVRRPLAAALPAEDVVALSAAPVTANVDVNETLRSSPLMFIENVGQFDEGVRFQVRGGNGTLWLADDALWITVMEPPAPDSRTRGREMQPDFQNPPSEVENRQGVNLRLSFPNANSHARLDPFAPRETTVSYFLGNDPDGWRPDVPVWGGVRYVDLYPGIDLEVTSEGGQLVQRLHAQPGANLGQVQLRVEGAEAIELDSAEVLRFSTAVGDYILPLLTVADTVPDVYPAVSAVGTATFDVVFPFTSSSAVQNQDSYSHLLYGTFLGGSGGEIGWGIAVDTSGAAYVTGETGSSDFPTTPGAFDTSYSDGDAFVVKLNAEGSSLIYSTFLGGSSGDSAKDIAIDIHGAAYVTGLASPDFPTTPGAFDTTSPGGKAFVVKLNPEGSGLIYSTFLGGSALNQSTAIAVDGAGAAYVTGDTSSSDFPTTLGAFDTTYNGGVDAFVAKLNAEGSALSYSTFLGGSADFDRGDSIAVDGAGAAYVTGRTYSSDFPTTPGAFDTTLNGAYDSFVIQLNSTGSALAYATFLGSGGGIGIAVDDSGAAYVTGDAGSDFPTTPGAFKTTLNSDYAEAFVAKLNPGGSALTYATFLGGSNGDCSEDIIIDASGAAYITGYTYSSDFPTTPGAFDTSYNYNRDAFVVNLNAEGSALSYSTFLGGSNNDLGESIAVDTNGTIYVMGYTYSSDFPTTPGAFDTTGNGGDPYPWDAFVAKLRIHEKEFIDLSISVYQTVDVVTRRAYENILGFYADAIYEMSNGQHLVRNVTIYQAGEFEDGADVLWNANEWPRAHPSGYNQMGLHVWMGDVFAFLSPYNALAQNNWRGAGYTLAHEWGHYYYSLYDEYELQPDDLPVSNSVMNSQWNALGGDFNWLNFSVAHNNTKRNEQHRVYAASGWETLARPVSEDPRDGSRLANPVRLYYPELASVAPSTGLDASVELSTIPTQTTRSVLRFVWVEPAFNQFDVRNTSNYRVTVRSVLGDQVTYPEPAVAVCTVINGDLIAGAEISATVITPNGQSISMDVKDDGNAPDVLANDGLYSGIMPYNQGGVYTITCTFDNDSGSAFFTQASTAHAIGPNGEVYSETLQSVGENFTATGINTVTIQNFQNDEHGNTPQTATILPDTNVDIAGRVDYANDIDLFRITPTQTGILIVRVSDLALSMHPHIRIMAEDGITVIGDFYFQPQAGKYFFTRLDAEQGVPFYVELSHLNNAATMGLYNISAGAPLINTIEERDLFKLYLPLVLRSQLP